MQRNHRGTAFHFCQMLLVGSKSQVSPQGKVQLWQNDYSKVMLWTECLCPQRIHVEALTPSMSMFGDMKS